jgi:DUF971 family protein
MVETLTKLQAIRELGVFRVGWSDNSEVEITFHRLRCACPCAGCIDEMTGIKILNEASVPADIAPVQLAYSGNYAMKVTWSDGHNTGLYSWEFLQKLASASEP